MKQLIMLLLFDVDVDDDNNNKVGEDWEKRYDKP